MTIITKKIQTKLNKLTRKYAGKKFVKVEMDILHSRKIKVYENEITEIKYNDRLGCFDVIFAETPKMDVTFFILVRPEQKDGKMKAEKALERLEKLITCNFIKADVRYNYEEYGEVEEITTDNVFNGDVKTMKAAVIAEFIKIANKKIAALQREIKRLTAE